MKAAIAKMFNAKVNVQAYKINIYQKGGHFKQHVDTPTHGASMLG